MHEFGDCLDIIFWMFLCFQTMELTFCVIATKNSEYFSEKLSKHYI